MNLTIKKWRDIPTMVMIKKSRREVGHHAPESGDSWPRGRSRGLALEFYTTLPAQ